MTPRRHKQRSAARRAAWMLLMEQRRWDGMSLFSPDMTDAAHYAADRTLLALHSESKHVCL